MKIICSFIQMKSDVLMRKLNERERTKKKKKEEIRTNEWFCYQFPGLFLQLIRSIISNHTQCGSLYFVYIQTRNNNQLYGTHSQLESIESLNISFTESQRTNNNNNKISKQLRDSILLLSASHIFNHYVPSFTSIITLAPFFLSFFMRLCPCFAFWIRNGNHRE